MERRPHVNVLVNVNVNVHEECGNVHEHVHVELGLLGFLSVCFLPTFTPPETTSIDPGPAHECYNFLSQSDRGPSLLVARSLRF